MLQPSRHDCCIGAVVGKNPGSAQPRNLHATGLQPVALKGDRCLPTIRSIVNKAYKQANQAIPTRSYIQVLNLFYLCEPNLKKALQVLSAPNGTPIITNLKTHFKQSFCATEAHPFPWVWYVWGGNQPQLNCFKSRFDSINTSIHFFYDKTQQQVVVARPSPQDFAKHTQGLKHEAILPFLANLLIMI